MAQWHETICWRKLKAQGKAWIVRAIIFRFLVLELLLGTIRKCSALLLGAWEAWRTHTVGNTTKGTVHPRPTLLQNHV